MVVIGSCFILIGTTMMITVFSYRL